MRHRSIYAFSILFLFNAAIHAAKPSLPKEVAELIPKGINLNDPSRKDAKKELGELVKNCGAGVVNGAKNRDGIPLPNRCSFTIELDELFFTPVKDKTGLLPEQNWPLKKSVAWFEPPMREVPEDFDLRDLMKNGQPEIRKQNCGDCWAWSTHHGLEIARAVHDQEVHDHSIQTVLSCSKAGSCGGGYMSAVGFLTKGLPEEDEFPYAGTDKFCKFNSSDLSNGWDGKIIAAPYIGRSLDHSRGAPKENREGNKVTQMMNAMYEWKAPLVVTVSAYSISGAGVYDSCSAINSGGNHMVAIVGWDTLNGKRIAHVWNSWGLSHGENGVSRIQWECGDGKLNRGLGVSARVVQYKSPCTPPDATQDYLHELKKGQSVQIGVAQPANTKCSWTPTTGLSNPNSCVTSASPSVSTEYHLTAENECGKSSSMTLVHLWGARGKSNKILTPFGLVAEK